MQGTQIAAAGLPSRGVVIQERLGPVSSQWRQALSDIGVMALVVLAPLALASFSTPVIADSSAPDVGRQKALVHMVRQECGFCHGLRLTGGLGTPLTADVMRDRPAEAMVATILYGREGTAMPGWAPFITEAEAEWIVRKLQEGFPQ